MTVPAPPQSADTEEVATPPRHLTGVATLVLLVATVVVMALGLGAWFRGSMTAGRGVFLTGTRDGP